MNGVRDKENPFAQLVNYIQNWEKMLQNHHCKVGLIGATAEEDAGGRDGGVAGKPVSPEALGLVEITDEVRKLKFEILKMSGLTASGKLPRAISATSIEDFSKLTPKDRRRSRNFSGDSNKSDG